MVKKIFQKIFHPKTSSFGDRCDKLYEEICYKITKAKMYDSIGITFIVESADAAVLEVVLFRLREEGFVISEPKRLYNSIQVSIFFS